MEPSGHLETKGQFAARCGVSAGRVSQWIKEELISGDALAGEGRNAKVRVDVALQQLRLRRDIGQALGNGIDTKLDDAAPGGSQALAPSVGSTPPKLTGGSPGDIINEQLKRERLWKLQAENRELAEKEAARQGLYTETSTCRAEMGRIAGQMIRIFEGALPDIATGLAAALKIDARDVRHQLNEQFRKVREQAAQAAEQQAARLPSTVEHEVVGATE